MAKVYEMRRNVKSLPRIACSKRGRPRETKNWWTWDSFQSKTEGGVEIDLKWGEVVVAVWLELDEGEEREEEWRNSLGMMMRMSMWVWSEVGWLCWWEEVSEMSESWWKVSSVCVGRWVGVCVREEESEKEKNAADEQWIPIQKVIYPGLIIRDRFGQGSWRKL